jgi:hypothetical protein
VAGLFIKGVKMKKRNPKLSLHRETVIRLESLPSGRVAGGLAARDAVGDMSSCGQECGCVETGTYAV